MKAMLSRGIIFLLVLAGMPAQAIEPLILYDQFNAKRIDPEKWSGVEGFAAPRNPNAEASRLIRRGALRVQLKTYRGGGVTINGTSARRDRPVATRILNALARLADGRVAAARFIGLRMSTHGAIHMKIHLVDCTYELFRSFFGAPPKKAPDGREVGATLGLLNSLLSLLSKSGATHLACAFDHVIESFRNDLFTGYKTSTGVASDLLAQFSLAEEAVAALGVVVWPMVAFEADDALAAAATRLRSEPGVDQVVICSPDKDLAQVVSGNQVVCWDRRRGIMYDEEAVLAKFGVRPGSIPDWLALVGDAADGYPGLPGWGPKSASALLSRYEHLESIPEDPGRWDLGRARALRLAESLRAHQADVLLYRRLATLRQDVPLHERSLDLEWHGAQDRLKPLCRELGDDKILARVPRWISASPAS